MHLCAVQDEFDGDGSIISDFCLPVAFLMYVVDCHFCRLSAECILLMLAVVSNWFGMQSNLFLILRRHPKFM